MLEHILDDVERVFHAKANWAGLTLALTIPDICGRAELLIVVAIIGVLVAISIPIFSSQLEKSRRAVDLSNARSVESTLLYALMDGELKLDDGQAAYVCVNRNHPCECKVTTGGSKGMTTTDEFQKLVRKSGIVTDDLRVKCRNVDNGGWYWYCFYVYGNGEHGVVSSTNAAPKRAFL